METPFTVKDSGARENFETGSRRDTRKGKGRYDLLPPRALRRVAKHFEAGAEKYGDRNWEKGQPLSRYLDSGLRHVLTYLEGERDEDHAAAAAWNFLCLLETEERIAAGFLPAELNDLPVPTNEVEALSEAPAQRGPCQCEIFECCPKCDPEEYAREMERLKERREPLKEGA